MDRFFRGIWREYFAKFENNSFFNSEKVSCRICREFLVDFMIFFHRVLRKEIVWVYSGICRKAILKLRNIFAWNLKKVARKFDKRFVNGYFVIFRDTATEFFMEFGDSWPKLLEFMGYFFFRKFPAEFGYKYSQNLKEIYF